MSGRRVLLRYAGASALVLALAAGPAGAAEAPTPQVRGGPLTLSVTVPGDPTTTPAPTPAPTGPAAGDLPGTGARNVPRLLFAAALLVAAGTALYSAARRTVGPGAA